MTVFDKSLCILLLTSIVTDCVVLYKCMFEFYKIETIVIVWKKLIGNCCQRYKSNSGKWKCASILVNVALVYRVNSCPTQITRQPGFGNRGRSTNLLEKFSFPNHDKQVDVETDKCVFAIEYQCEFDVETNIGKHLLVWAELPIEEWLGISLLKAWGKSLDIASHYVNI